MNEIYPHKELELPEGAGKPQVTAFQHFTLAQLELVARHKQDSERRAAYGGIQRGIWQGLSAVGYGPAIGTTDAPVEIDPLLLAASRAEVSETLPGRGRVSRSSVREELRVWPLAEETIQSLPPLVQSAHFGRWRGYAGCPLMKQIRTMFMSVPVGDDTWRALEREDAARCQREKAAQRVLQQRELLVWSEDKTPLERVHPICSCVSCKEFRVKLPVGEPLLCSLTELSRVKPEGSDDILCSFTGLADGRGREFNWGEGFVDQDHYDGMDDIVRFQEVSIGMFLLRKKDGKRLELSGPKLESAYTDRWGDFDESLMECEDGLWDWDLPIAGNTGGLAFKNSVRFKATLHYKDRNIRQTLPTDLSGEELDDWMNENYPHEHELLLDSLVVSLAPTKEPEDYEYESGEPEWIYRTSDPDDLLAMLSNPTFAHHWM